MIFLKILLFILTVFICIYFLLYLRQLRVIKRAVPELAMGKLFFISVGMILLSGTFGIMLLLSLGYEALLEGV